jgi:hypothetical protein
MFSIETGVGSPPYPNLSFQWMAASSGYFKRNLGIKAFEFDLGSNAMFFTC